MDMEYVASNFTPIYSNHPIITHLIYTPSAISKSDYKSVHAIKRALEKFSISGVCINQDKSKIYFSKGNKHKDFITTYLNIKASDLPVKYLGLSLSSKKTNSRIAQDILDKIKNKMSWWSNRFLSTAGWIELINSSIYPLVYFWIQSCQLFTQVIGRIESLCASFIWNNKYHKVFWDQMCLPKANGGVGLKNIKDMQVVMTLKLIWTFLQGNSL